MTSTWEVFAGHGKRCINRCRCEPLGSQTSYQSLERLFVALQLLNSLECAQTLPPLLEAHFGDEDVAPAIGPPHAVIPAEVDS